MWIEATTSGFPLLKWSHVHFSCYAKASFSMSWMRSCIYFIQTSENMRHTGIHDKSLGNTKPRSVLGSWNPRSLLRHRFHTPLLSRGQRPGVRTQSRTQWNFIASLSFRLHVVSTLASKCQKQQIKFDFLIVLFT